MLTLSSPDGLDNFHLYFIYLIHIDLSIDMSPLDVHIIVLANEAVQEE